MMSVQDFKEVNAVHEYKTFGLTQTALRLKSVGGQMYDTSR